MIPVDKAINAYSSVANSFAGQGSAGGDAVSTTGSGPSFGDFLSSAVSNAIDTGHTAEAVSAKGLVHQASANDVVMAMTNFEVTMQEVTKIRDQVVSAYEDIIKMPI
jgi:flagellar hook-basal body complex protein FliE